MGGISLMDCNIDKRMSATKQNFELHIFKESLGLSVVELHFLSTVIND